MNDPAGSKWRKWDLHVHTPASLFHNYKGTPDQAWEVFLQGLAKASTGIQGTRHK